MSDILARLKPGGFLPFAQLFSPHEGRMGVTLSFVAILELMREGLLEIVQTESYGPLHVRAANPQPQLRIVGAESEEQSGTAALSVPPSEEPG